MSFATIDRKHKLKRTIKQISRRHISTHLAQAFHSIIFVQSFWLKHLLTPSPPRISACNTMPPKNKSKRRRKSCAVPPRVPLDDPAGDAQRHEHGALLFQALLSLCALCGLTGMDLSVLCYHAHMAGVPGLTSHFTRTPLTTPAAGTKPTWTQCFLAPGHCIQFKFLSG